LAAGVCISALVPLGLATVFDDPPPAAAVLPLPGTGGGLRPGSVPARFESLVRQAGSMCGAAPPAVIAAQIQQESGWNPKAVSSAGAEGISQFLPSTWPNWSKPGQSPFDPAAAILAQGRYDCAIAKSMAAARREGRLPRAIDLTSAMLAGYNAGPGTAAAWLREPGGSDADLYAEQIPYVETATYVRRVYENYRLYRELYGR